MSQENTLSYLHQLQALFTEQQGWKSEQCEELKSTMTQLTSQRLPVFVGRVADSKVYRIGLGGVELETILRFKTPERRNEFANTFERICREDAGVQVHQSF